METKQCYILTVWNTLKLESRQSVESTAEANVQLVLTVGMLKVRVC